MTHENEDLGDLTPREVRQYDVRLRFGRRVTVEIECSVDMTEGQARLLVRAKFSEREVQTVSAPRIVDTAVYE